MPLGSAREDVVPGLARVLSSPARRSRRLHLALPRARSPPELVLTVEGAKSHMRVLFERFGVGKLPQNRKRGRLVELAFAAGAVSSRECEA